MSDTNSDDWVDSPNDSPEVDEDRQSEADNVNASSVQQDEQQFPRRSLEEVEETAANARRRTSSLSSGIAAMSPTELASAQPRQPTPPPPPHSSTLPNQIEHAPDQDRNRSPKSSLPDYHNPDSPTQKRGKGVFRNPVADTWREDAYMKKEPTHQKMTAREASEVQDRWRCEYCGRLNERGIETTTPENPATTELETLRRDTGSIRIGAAGPSRASTNPLYAHAPSTSSVSCARCEYCKEKLPFNIMTYDVRELCEDGII
ncbi:hypothetical protein AA0117_g4090 [Alternaria alternata]|uniref:Uncharacterized protein n=2 Tax=Alternaria alternata complex TaxID=187734 RepID=A0A4Q4NMA3_ALTAL|nr:hypothetical protein AA0114_g2200 [Alternaria tenuissima]RYN78898.1 hypothetical protein AA0117_g4090 [Alternaria alternata]